MQKKYNTGNHDEIPASQTRIERAEPNGLAGENIVGTDQEFPSNRIAWQAQKKHGVEYRVADLTHADEPELAIIAAKHGFWPSVQCNMGLVYG